MAGRVCTASTLMPACTSPCQQNTARLAGTPGTKACSVRALKASVSSAWPVRPRRFAACPSKRRLPAHHFRSASALSAASWSSITRTPCPPWLASSFRTAGKAWPARQRRSVARSGTGWLRGMRMPSRRAISTNRLLRRPSARPVAGPSDCSMRLPIRRRAGSLDWAQRASTARRHAHAGSSPGITNPGCSCMIVSTMSDRARRRERPSRLVVTPSRRCSA